MRAALAGSRIVTVALVLGWTAVLFLVLPTFVIVPVSLTTERFLSLPTDGISFQHYAALLGSEAWLASFRDSFVIGAVATTIAVVTGTLGAIAFWKLASRQAEWVRGLVLLPLIVPPVVTALALYKAWVALGLVGTFWGVAIAHAILAAPYVVVTVTAALAGVDPRIEQAARSLGATPLQAVRLVIVPNVKGGIISGALLAFVASWDEIVVTIFIAGRTIITVPKRMWDGIRDNVDPTTAAVATLLIAFTLVITLIRLPSAIREER